MRDGSPESFVLSMDGVLLSTGVSLGSVLSRNSSSGREGKGEMTGGSKLGSTIEDETGWTDISEV